MARARHTRRRRRSRRGGGAPLTLKFPSGTSVSTNSTPLLPQAAVQGQPVLSGPATASPGLKTLISWDPDAPAGTWLHWLVVNVPSSSPVAPSLDPSKGTTLVPWAPPTPPRRTGQHRYYFAVFDQPSTTPIEIPTPQQRAPFSPGEFAKTHGLRKLATTAFKVAASNSL